MTSCVEWRLNELSNSYSSRDNWKIVCQKRNTVTLGQADIQWRMTRIAIRILLIASRQLLSSVTSPAGDAASPNCGICDTAILVCQPLLP